MKIIEPKVELWQQGDDSKAHVARCARVCYGRETGNDEATIKRLIDSRHWSMFRHETYYAAVPIKKDSIIYKVLPNYKNCPYIKYFTYDTLWIRNKGLKEFFKELDSIQPINIIPKEHFYSIFGNVVKDFYNNQENENN